MTKRGMRRREADMRDMSSVGRPLGLQRRRSRTKMSRVILRRFWRRFPVLRRCPRRMLAPVDPAALREHHPTGFDPEKGGQSVSSDKNEGLSQWRRGGIF